MRGPVTAPAGAGEFATEAHEEYEARTEAPWLPLFAAVEETTFCLETKLNQFRT
jgi:hypothetical protein